VEDRRPALRVVAGNPSDDELAIVIAVVSARSASRTTVTTPTVSLWSRKSRNVRPPLHQGPGAWRASMMPR